MDDLLRAFWRGDLVADVFRTGDPRSVLLDIAARLNDHPGLIFIRPGEPVPVDVTDLPDGGALVDIRTPVEWPAPSSAEEATARRIAYEALAETRLDDYSPTVAPLLAALSISRDAFGSFCEANGYALPAFWFARTASRGTSGAAARCRTWLRKQAATGAKPASKIALRKQALLEVAGLTERAFDRVWDEVAPPAWKSGGRPRKAPR